MFLTCVQCLWSFVPRWGIVSESLLNRSLDKELAALTPNKEVSLAGQEIWASRPCSAGESPHEPIHLHYVAAELGLQVGIRQEEGDKPVCQSRGQLGPWALTVTLGLTVILLWHLAQVAIPGQKLMAPRPGPQD